MGVRTTITFLRGTSRLWGGGLLFFGFVADAVCFLFLTYVNGYKGKPGTKSSIWRRRQRGNSWFRMIGMQGRQGSYNTSLRLRSIMTTKQRAGMAFIGGVVEVEHISEGLQMRRISTVPLDTLALDGAPGLARRHRYGHGCFSYHNPMVAAVTVTPLDSGILLVSIANVPAVGSLLLFVLFMRILTGSWGRVREAESEDGSF